MIQQVSKGFVEAIVQAHLSPPICIGRYHTEAWASPSGFATDIYFVGVCSPEEMKRAIIRETQWKPR